MGKIGFRIRSKVNKQVSIYVYLYGTTSKQALEAKTGFVVLRDEWDHQENARSESQMKTVSV